MKDIKVTKCIRNERNELQISLIVKDGDYSESDRILLQDSKLNGDTLDIEFTGLVKGIEDDVIKKNRTKLEMALKHYCEHFSISYDEGLKELYRINKIKSRTELTNEQLEILIDSYNTAVRQDIM